MIGPPVQSEHFPRITQLWDRRASLSSAEWTELYRRVQATLTGFQPQEAAALPDALEDLRHLYFVERVLNGRAANAPAHLDALRLHWRRFLLDLLQQHANGWKPTGADDGPHACAQAGGLADGLANIQDDDAQAELHADILRRYGVTPLQVQAGAAAFLQTLEPDMLLLLRHGAPPHRVASAHYHCGKLGLVHSQKGQPASAGRQTALPAHRRTLLGRWAASTLRLDADLNQGDIEAVQIVLDSLRALASSASPYPGKRSRPGMHGLTPALATVAARLGQAAGAADCSAHEPGLEIDGAGGFDNGVERRAPASGADWRALAVPAPLAALFERAANVGVLAGRPVGAGQIHALAGLPGMAGVLLDSWQPHSQLWRGWVVAPDPAYAGPSDLVIEERDAPVDPRAGLVLCGWQLELQSGQLGACLGVLSQERVQAVRWLARHGTKNKAAPQPGVIARCALPDGYVLSGTPLAQDDRRLAYRRLIGQGLTQCAVATAGNPGGLPRIGPAALAAANSPRGLKIFAALASAVVLFQFGWIVALRQPPWGAATTSAPAPEYRGVDPQAARLVRVLFRAEASETEIRNWLRRERLEIVSGPDSLGAFTLRLDDERQTLAPPAADNPLAKIYL